VSYIIVDLDGTLILENDEPNQALIDLLNEEVMSGDKQIIIVSARKIDRLQETRAWLQEHKVAGIEEVHLNDFEGSAFATGLAFKEYKYGLLKEQYGDELECAIDNDAAVREMAIGLGLDAYSPEEYLAEESRAVCSVETTDPEATDRVLSCADALIAAEDREIVDMKEKETRSVPIGEFRLGEAGADGQRTFTGYASIWNSASAGLPFEEKIAPNAFKRSLSRAAAGQKIIAFLFGHDETRALATTASGRLQLTEDETGLRVEAKLDPADPDAAKVISMLTHESAAAGMSFGFQKVQDAWDGNNRTIKEANLFEVSILAAGGQTPAYPATLGLTAIRQVTAPKIGVEAEALLATLETIKAGRELSAEEVVVIDAVRSKLAPKPVGIDPSIAAALLAVSAAEGDAL